MSTFLLYIHPVNEACTRPYELSEDGATIIWQNDDRNTADLTEDDFKKFTTEALVVSMLDEYIHNGLCSIHAMCLTDIIQHHKVGTPNPIETPTQETAKTTYKYAAEMYSTSAPFRELCTRDDAIEVLSKIFDKELVIYMPVGIEYGIDGYRLAIDFVDGYDIPEIYASWPEEHRTYKTFGDGYPYDENNPDPHLDELLIWLQKSELSDWK